MFELFLIAVFSAAGMLLGNLIINCIVALSDYIESFYVENSHRKNNVLTLEEAEILGITKNKK